MGIGTILSYKVMIENTGINTAWYSTDLDGIGFDIIMNSTYSINGTLTTRNFVIDLYLYQECGGAIASDCTATNDTSASYQHQFNNGFWAIRWRIHNNPPQGQWISDTNNNIGWYLSNSLRIAYCLDNRLPASCSASPPQGNIVGITLFAETFGGTAGFAFDYIYLSQMAFSCSANANPTDGSSPLSVRFSASCSGGTTPYRFLWQFNDGSGASSSAQNPTHGYTVVPGDSSDTFYPTLTIADYQNINYNPSLPPITVYCTTFCPVMPAP